MSRYVRADLRRLVAARADRLCEYCLIHADDTFFGCEVDHIISVKHEGATTAENLAYACAFCNRNKGSDIGSVDPHSGNFVRFFNPRMYRWGEHFALHGTEISPKTDVDAGRDGGSALLPGLHRKLLSQLIGLLFSSRNENVCASLCPRHKRPTTTKTGSLQIRPSRRPPRPSQWSKLSSVQTVAAGLSETTAQTAARRRPVRFELSKS
ncbi:MAG: hypothetical protein BRD48_04805 [Bacteroidetes bacterium QS_9_68_14]|nr:MAG: hypothetical protein BRD48_04805 [Bacteroidetes bacterium QS_9_68_14]